MSWRIKDFLKKYPEAANWWLNNTPFQVRVDNTIWFDVVFDHEYQMPALGHANGIRLKDRWPDMAGLSFRKKPTFNDIVAWFPQSGLALREESKVRWGSNWYDLEYSYEGVKLKGTQLFLHNVDPRDLSFGPDERPLDLSEVRKLLLDQTVIRLGAANEEARAIGPLTMRNGRFYVGGCPIGYFDDTVRILFNNGYIFSNEQPCRATK